MPDPIKPQSFNRYSYVLNSPMNLVDPSGHCYEHYEEGSEQLTECLRAVDGLVNTYYSYYHIDLGQDVDKDGVRDIWQQQLTIEDANYLNGILLEAKSEHMRQSKPTPYPERECQYWENCYDPVGEYGAIGGNAFIGGQLILDDWGNVYLNVHISAWPGFGTTVGNIEIYDGERYIEIEDLAVDQQEQVVEEFLTGWSTSICIAMGTASCGVSNTAGNKAKEFGLASPGVGGQVGYTFLVYDNGNDQPWFYQSWFGQ